MMASPNLQLSDLIVHIDVEPHFAHPSFQKNINLEVSHPMHGNIASLTAFRFNRNASRVGGRFLRVMDEDMQELADFSQVLFDKYGFLKKHFIENPHLRGTGAWGREMNSGALIYILAITVDKNFRGHGLGSWMLQKLLGSALVKDDDFLVCWPTPIDSEINAQGRARSELWTKIQESVICFFRRNNFRRIGRTQFFALSPNIDHPSRAIPAEADASHVSAAWSATSHLANQSEEVDKWSQLEAQRNDVELRHARYPLHSGIYESKGESISQRIQAAYDANPDSIHQQDDHGFTPVFTAASTKNLDALRKLIELGASKDLTRRDNADGLTPLEACTQRMISTKEFSETLLPRWDGFFREELLCVAAMKRVVSPSHMTVTDEDYAARRKWGCTCGMCLDGWLSLRMKMRLEYEGEIMFDMMEDTIGFVNREPLAADAAFLAPGVEFIPLHLRDQLYKSFYRGYRCAFEAVTYVSRQNNIPYPATVRRAMEAGGFRGHDYFASRAISLYFSKGGLPDFALDCLLDAVEEQSPLGDSEFDSTFDGDLQKLPECANDLEFNLVRQNLGLDAQARGPYRDQESEPSMNFSEEDDDIMDIGEEVSD